MTTPYTAALHRLAHKPFVTIACGATCAYLGDERNLREFLVADETAQRLRRAGHIVVSFLIDDDLDPLTFQQLRIAVNKDPVLLRSLQRWCGKPIAHLPCPWGCCDSYARHFEQALLTRLHALDCHPILIRASDLYARGVYAPYVQQVLERSDDIMRFLSERFKNYQPEKLFWAICPHCGYIDETYINEVADGVAAVACRRCDQTTPVELHALRGKLNWKLDCAVRWAVLRIDAEPFNKAYLEPQTGTFQIAQALSQAFFGGQPVLPLHYGQIQMDKRLGLKLLQCLPPAILRAMLVEHPSADMTITRDLLITVASRSHVQPGLTYLNFVKQVLPIWALTPEQLTPEQRDLVAHGLDFKAHFMNQDIGLHLPRREDIESEDPEILTALHSLLSEMLRLRERCGGSWEHYQPQAIKLMAALGPHKGRVLRRLRHITGQRQGLPITRLLFLLPAPYLELLAYVIDLYLASMVVAELGSAPHPYSAQFG